MRRTLTRTGTLVLAAALGLTGCSGDSKKATTSGTSGAAPSVAAATPATTLATAKRMLDDTSGVHLVLTSANVPSKVSGLINGEGDGSHAPAFKGTIGVRIAVAGTVSVPVVAVDGSVWAKTPLSPKLTKISPQQFGAPDPAQIFATTGGFSSLLLATKAPKFGGKQRDGRDIVQTITGTLPGSAIQQTLSFGDASKTYAVVYLVTGKGQLRSARLTGEFYQGGDDTSYTIAFTQYGEKVAVTAP